jgi:cytochrome c oxidase subunit 1
MMDYRLGQLHFWLTFLSVYLIFTPMHYMGITGVPRRYYSFTNFDTFSVFSDLNIFMSTFSVLSFLSQFVFFYNFFYSIFRGRVATQNP